MLWSSEALTSALVISGAWFVSKFEVPSAVDAASILLAESLSPKILWDDPGDASDDYLCLMPSSYQLRAPMVQPIS